MNTQVATKTSIKNKIATFRFTLTPKMESVFSSLEQKYKMLDRTEIVKLGLSNLAAQTKNDDDDSSQFDTFDQAMEFWNSNKKDFRL